MKPVIVHDIEKIYGRDRAVKGISFDVNKGELFGLIGPDGAGKTTLFRILATLLKPEQGSATVLGFDVVRDYRKIRSRVGYMPGRFSLYRDLSVEENLDFFASVFGTTVEANYELVKPIYRQLEPFNDRLAGALSGGMKQKLALCCALIHKPDLLLLDEPTTGVDAVSRTEFWEMLHRLKEEGITILVSTPYMDEAQQCDRIALLQKGELLSVDSPKEIVKQFEMPLVAIKTQDKYRLLQVLRSYESAAYVQPFGEFIHYADHRIDIPEHEIRKYLDSKQITDIEIVRIEPDIEDIFMHLMIREEL